MRLRDWIEENKNRQIEFEDGIIRFIDPDSSKYLFNAGDRYWYVDTDGSVDWFPWEDMPYDCDTYDFGNVFKTEVEALEAAKLVKETLLKLREESK